MRGEPLRATRVTVRPEDAGRRLDNFLQYHLKGVPRPHIHRLVRKGEVRVNSRRATAAQRLQAGDEVRVPPVRPGKGPSAVVPGGASTRWLDARILMEDDALLVLSKPAGLAVHGGSGISLGAIELLRARAGDRQRLELVHRLDRDTSGCLLVAKTTPALRHLHAQFRDGAVRKGYLALLMGRWPGRARRVDAPLLTTERRGGERHVRVDAAGKMAVTHFVPLERFVDAALMQVWLETGRTHQIRVHAASVGHPVAGDTRYAPEGQAVLPPGLRRMFLHAHSLSFSHPSSGEGVTVEAPLDDELTAVLDRLRAAACASAEADAHTTQAR